MAWWGIRAGDYGIRSTFTYSLAHLLNGCATVDDRPAYTCTIYTIVIADMNAGPIVDMANQKQLFGVQVDNAVFNLVP